MLYILTRKPEIIGELSDLERALSDFFISDLSKKLQTINRDATIYPKKIPNPPIARQNMRGQTNICLQKIYVEVPVQNNEKSKIENVVSIILDGPLQG